MKRSWRIVAAALAVVVAFGAIGAGIVAADVPDEFGPSPGGAPGWRGRGGFAGMKEVVELLDTTVSEILGALRDGKTIAELAADKGVDVKDLMDAIVSNGGERNADLVERGLLTPDQADARNARPRQRAESIVTLPLPYGLQGEALGVAAEALGISIDDLIAEIEAGKTVAEVAEAEGVDPEDIVDALVAARKESHEELISLDLMTETQAALALDRYQNVAEHFVTNGYQCPPPSQRFFQRMAGAAQGRGVGRGRFMPMQGLGRSK